MQKRKINLVTYSLAIFLLGFAWRPVTVSAERDPKLLIDKSSTQNPLTVGAGGINFKYKRVSGPYDFEGDMIVWGVRGFGGHLREAKLGVMGSTGSLNGNVLRLNLNMGGLSIENGFRPDPRFKWRVNFGGGNFELTSKVTHRTINSGSFTYLEPMLVGVFPLSRHLVLEFGTGYTFCGAQGVRLEGILLQVDLLVGRF